MNRTAFWQLVSGYLLPKGPLRSAGLKRIRGGILGIALSLVPLVLVIEIANGMIEGISTRFLETFTYHVRLSGLGAHDPQRLEDLSLRLQKSGLAVHAFPEMQGTGLLRGVKGAAGVMVRAVSPRLFAEDSGFRNYMRVSAGTFQVDSPGDMVVGTAIADKLGLAIGDKVRLLTFRTEDFGGLPKISVFTVRGIAGSGYQELDRTWVFVNLERGLRVLEPSTSQTIIGAKLADPFRLPNPLSEHGPVIDLDRYRLDVEHTLGREWVIRTWFETQEDQFRHYIDTKNILILPMILIVLVASVNVLATMVLIVVEKQHEIAMLKVLGAVPQAMGRLFLAMGGIVGAIGAVIGIVAGSLLSAAINEVIGGLEWCINGVLRLFHWLGHGFSDSGFQALQLLNPEFYLERIPIHLQPGDLLLILGLTLCLSVAASIIPARRAARLSPVELFRRV